MADEEMKEEVMEEAKPKKRNYTKKKTNVITGKVNASAFTEAVGDIEKDSMVNGENIANILIQTMEQAYLEWSYPGLFKDKDSDEPAKELIRAEVIFDDKGFKINDVKTVTAEDDIVDDAYQISLEDAQAISKKAQIGDEIRIPFDVTLLDKAYVRRVKQLFQSKLKDASRQAILSVYQNQLGELIEGTVTKSDPEAVSYEISFGKANGILRKRDVMPTDHFQMGDRVTVYLESLDDKSNPPSLKVTRTSEKFIAKLFERNIIEIQNGDVTICGIAREAGRRTKVFVKSANPNIDPVGACIGPESSRINAILSAIHPEKVDILPYYANKAKQIISAMTPAKIIGIDCPEDFFDPNVHYDELEADRDYEFPKVSIVVQNGDQGVAIGSKGVNVRLASKLTKTSISVHTADEAIKLSLKYMMLAKVDEAVAALEAKPAEEEAAAPVAETTPVETVAQPVEETAAETAITPSRESAVTEPVKEATPASLAEAPVSEPVKEEPKVGEVEHIEIKNKPKISLDELEQAISQKKGPSETRSRKRFRKNDEENKNEPSIAAQAEAMPIYTEEELAQFDDQNEEEQYDEYDDELEEYDSDKYYDGETK